MEIKLMRGGTALIDKSDLGIISKYKWFKKVPSVASGGKIFYAYASKGGPLLQMHRFIMNAPRNKKVDHINGDGLDNRRGNLRFATPSQNACNKRAFSRCGFKGVTKHSKKKTIFAQIKHKGKNIYLGSYKTNIEAAKAYDIAAINYFGEFAKLNFPLERI